MEPNPLYLPILVQVGLTFLVLFRLAYGRVTYLKKHGMAEVRKTGFPAKLVNSSDNLKNQFETPVLFYVLCFFFITSGAVSQHIVWAAWAYVALRIIHAIIQLGKNVIFPWRFGAFFLSTVVLIYMLGNAVGTVIA